MASPLYVLQLPVESSVIYAVACDDPKQSWFQSAAHLMQEALQFHGVEANNGVERRDGYLDDAEDWPLELMQALRAVDEEAGAPQRLFTMATVKHGPFSGMQAIGIGSNQNKLKRSSNLALAFAIARRSEQRMSQELQSLAAVPTRLPLGITAQPAAQPQTCANLQHECDDDEVVLTTSLLSTDWDVDDGTKVSTSTEMPAKATMAWLDADSPVDCAKQRLVCFRRQEPILSPELQRRITSCLNGNAEAHTNGSESVAAVLEDLDTVLKGDSWKGSPCGQDWIRDWQKWKAPFSDSSKFHFGKGTKAQANYRWYFGCDGPKGAPSSSSLNTCGEKSLQVPTPPSPLPSTPVEKNAGANSTHKHSSKSIYDRPPRAPPACALPLSNLMRRTSPSSSSSSSKSLSEESEREIIMEGLARDEAYESLTIGTLTSADTIPLGTDLDPQNHYNNLWAARQIQDPDGKLLVQYNLCCRVLDGENLGYSFGAEVGRRPKYYDVEGVKRAVDHFQKRGIDVVVVTKRQELSQAELGDGVQVVVAERTDDVMILKHAKNRNCPIVSRDGFAKWKKDLKISRELRQWLTESADLQVRFSWGTGGEFMPDFDHPRPVLKPQSNGGK